MGVRDLTSVVKKLARGCITPIPSLRSFAGQRFAIDANLLSTKFFFVRAKDREAAPFGEREGPTRLEEDADIGRHLARSWYYFLLALRKEGIRPIVVFDGQSRVKEKERENERRRKARELQRLRGEAEGLRGGRLREIQGVWGGLRSGEERGRVADAFRVRVSAEEDRRTEDVEERAEEASPAAPTCSPIDPLPHLPSPSPSPTPPTSVAQPLEGETLATEPTLPPTNSPFPPSAPPSPPSPPPPHSPPPPAIDPSTLLHPHEQTAVHSLHSLHTSFRLDSLNPVYSKNQVLLIEEERAFFASLLQGGQPAPPDYASPPPLSYKGDDARVGVEEESSSEVEERARRYYEELDDIIERSDKLGRSHTSRSVAIPKSAFKDVKTLIHALGIPYLEPSPSEPHEAEGVCSALYALGLVDYVVSEDLDVVVYDAPLLRRITTSANGEKGKGKGMEGMAVMHPGKMRELLGLTREEFVDWALLCGTDFTERIPYLGPMTALKLIRQHSTIESLLENTHGKYVPLGEDVEAYLQTVRDARAIFLSLPKIAAALPLPLPHSPSDSSSLSSNSAAAPQHVASSSLSTFSGSLDPRPPSPDLPAILRRLGIRQYGSAWSGGAAAAASGVKSPAARVEMADAQGGALERIDLGEYDEPEEAVADDHLFDRGEGVDGDAFTSTPDVDGRTPRSGTGTGRGEAEWVARKRQEEKMAEEFERMFL